MAREYTRTTQVLGNIPWFGPIILWEDFEGGMTWDPDGDGTDYLVEITDEKSFWGYTSCHLKTRTSGATAGDTVQIQKYMGVLPPKIVECEIQLSLGTVSRIDSVGIDLDVYMGDDEVRGGIAIDPISDQVMIMDSAGNWINQPGLAQDFTTNRWYRFKFRMDLENALYKYIRANDLERDTGFAGTPYTASGVGADHAMIITIALQTELASPAEAWIDSVLITTQI